MKKRAAKAKMAIKTFDPNKYQNTGMTPEEIMEIKDAFDLFDSDGSGEIDTSELKSALNQMGLGSQSEMLTKLIGDIDKNGNASIDIDEFVEMLCAKIEESDTREGLKKIYDMFCDGNSQIDAKGLKKIVAEVGDSITDEQVENMIAKADTDHDGLISFDEFYDFMTKKI